MRQFTTAAGEDLGFELGLAAYNAGPHNARRWLKTFPSEDPDAFVERIPFKETPPLRQASPQKLRHLQGPIR